MNYSGRFKYYSTNSDFYKGLVGKLDKLGTKLREDINKSHGESLAARLSLTEAPETDIQEWANNVIRSRELFDECMSLAMDVASKLDKIDEIQASLNEITALLKAKDKKEEDD